VTRPAVISRHELREHAAQCAVTAELNAASGNPLVRVPDQALVCAGNFYPVVLAIARDVVRIALAQAGQLATQDATCGTPSSRWPAARRRW
jgi:histidine ammonia-lyase